MAETFKVLQKAGVPVPAVRLGNAAITRYRYLADQARSGARYIIERRSSSGGFDSELRVYFLEIHSRRRATSGS
ncbi:hypothetical protein N7510_006989 [Penicillium lagena]|uniref:uncharacterized protein n=1 Tax=Penicillium lagena TaxID=94218 RepID=UPI002540635A|nr:uncharacterized protein N7510_006989 [Penicillium lagena]KAJ5610270.1 hypothetical protein N7510_006989 [Penicillium lagena]